VSYYIPIATALANRHKLALGPFFLGIVYRAMDLACTQPRETIGGPLWFIQLLAYAYFPQQVPKPNPYVTEKCICYGQWLAEASYDKDNIPTYGDWFFLFADINRIRSPPCFRPFSEAKYTSPNMKLLNYGVNKVTVSL
jgi:hypothetical protein